MYSFIVIDDSELDCFITQKIIEYVDENANIGIFYNAQDALDAIRKNPIENNDITAVILLDLQMPVMNGFQFVEEFEKLPRGIQTNYLIHILSSTRNAIDLHRLSGYRTVNSIIEKPFTQEKLAELLLNVRSNV